MANKPSISKIMGPTNSYNGVPIQTVTPPTYANPVPQNGNYQQFLASLQQAQAQANQQNQTDFGQALGLETQGFENQQQSIQQAIQAQQNYGQSEQTQLQQQLANQLGANTSSNIARGLGNTTIAQTSQAPILNNYNQGVAGIANQAANLQAGLYSNLASSESQGANSIANLLAQENNTPPNQALLAQLQQQAKAGAQPSTVTNFSGAQPPINSAGGGGQIPAGNSGVAPPKIPTVPPVPMSGPGAASNPAQGLNYTSTNGSEELPPSQFNSPPLADTQLTADSGGGNSPQANAQSIPPPTPNSYPPASTPDAGQTPGADFSGNELWNQFGAAFGQPSIPQPGPGTTGPSPEASASPTADAAAPPPGAPAPTPTPAPINIAPGSPQPAPSAPSSISSAMQTQQTPAPGGGTLPAYWQNILSQIGYS